ncbi:MAG TPA: SagB/ThcOx family dehydrogenase [Spirochaetia bacterium]|nr:SagB/ThcOx family dehydrogenase [Spirochaetia bacterium]
MKKTASTLKENKTNKVLEFAKKWSTPLLTALLVISLSVTAFILNLRQRNNQTQSETPVVQIVLPGDSTALPQPDIRSSNSLETVLKNRKTRLDFTNGALTLKQISQLLWAAQGINVDWGDRTAPSFKSTYPLTVFLIANKVDGLEAGEYQYIPGDRTPVHQLKPIKKVEMGDALFKLLNQNSFNKIPAVLVITGNMSKMAEAYGGIPHDKEVYLEAGFIAQNIALQVESLKLGTTISTNFDELKLKELITVSSTDTIIYLMPVGIPK